MGSYEFIEHTADIGLRCEGSSREDLFGAAARGMTAYLYGPAVLQQTAAGSQQINLKALDFETLLVDWLSQLLFLSTTSYQACITFEIDPLPQPSLGARVGMTSAIAEEDIKAVTYSGLKIEEKAGVFQATIVFDI